MTPGQLFFPWKLWGYGVVRDYWDHKKDDWREIEDELHRKVCLLHILLHVISCISSISCIYICCCTRMTIYSRHTIPWPTLHTVSFSSLFVYIDFSVTSANSEAPNRKLLLRSYFYLAFLLHEKNSRTFCRLSPVLKATMQD